MQKVLVASKSCVEGQLAHVARLGCEHQLFHNHQIIHLRFEATSTMPRRCCLSVLGQACHCPTSLSYREFVEICVFGSSLEYIRCCKRPEQSGGAPELA